MPLPSPLPLVVEVCGSHSTGKTTLMESVQFQINTRFSTLKTILLPSVSRTQLKEMGLKIYKDVDETHQSFISLGNMMNLINLIFHSDNDIIFTTDIGIRGLAYSMAGKLHPTFLEYQRGVVRHLLQLNGVHFALFMAYLPIEFTVQEDGVRDLDETYRKLVDDCIKMSYSLFGITPKVLRGSVEERTSILMISLSAYLHHLHMLSNFPSGPINRFLDDQYIK